MKYDDSIHDELSQEVDYETIIKHKALVPCTISAYDIDDGRFQERIDLIYSLFFKATHNERYSSQFLGNMLTAVRFLDSRSDKEHIAFTIPDGRIFLNYDNIYPDFDDWYFIYCHECMHQLWDTFEVGKILKKEGYEYYPRLLNYASDCVINEYLKKKKIPIPEGLVTAQYIKSNYDVVYDYRKDDQASLYIKMLESQHFQDLLEEAKNSRMGNDDADANSDKNPGRNKRQEGGQEGQGGQEGGQDSQGGQQGGKQGGGKGGKNNEKYSEDYLRGYNDTIRKYMSGELKI